MPKGWKLSASQEKLVEECRDLLKKEVEKRSLRKVAREVGLSPTGLAKFLLGSTPYSPTIRKLERWREKRQPIYPGRIIGVGDAY